MPEETTSPPLSSTLGHIRVLAIDDSEEFLALIKDLLATQGFEVVGLTNPVKALERFRIEQDTFQLVLLDYLMPDLDGGATFKWLKKMSPSIKVIIVSGADELHLRRILAQYKVDGCIRKPFNLHEALQIIRNVMSNEKQGLSKVGL
jgi:two-component system cell cycle sensor histidine kinase/response regulator CckA